MKNLGVSLILTRGTSFEGRLSFEGTARLCGSFKGEIVSLGVLIVDLGARVEARIKAQEVIIKGWAKGEIVATQTISLMSGSEFHGALSAPCLNIEEGAFFEGASITKSQS